MHLGLKTGPLSPLRWCQVMGVLVLYRSSDCPHIQTPNVIWVQKGAHIKLIRDVPFPEPFYMSLKKSRKMNPFRVLQRGPLWRELSVSRVFFYMSLEFLITFLINRNYTLLSKALGKECPPMFPKTGTLWKQTSIYRTLHSIFFEVRSKGALLPGSPHRAPTERERERERERDALFPEPSFIHLSQSLLNEPLSMFSMLFGLVVCDKTAE